MNLNSAFQAMFSRLVVKISFKPGLLHYRKLSRLCGKVWMKKSLLKLFVYKIRTSSSLRFTVANVCFQPLASEPALAAKVTREGPCLRQPGQVCLARAQDTRTKGPKPAAPPLGARWRSGARGPRIPRVGARRARGGDPASLRKSTQLGRRTAGYATAPQAGCLNLGNSGPRAGADRKAGAGTARLQPPRV